MLVIEYQNLIVTHCLCSSIFFFPSYCANHILVNQTIIVTLKNVWWGGGNAQWYDII